MSSNIEPRIKTVEEAMQALTQLAVNASERMDTHESWINELAAQQVSLTTEQVNLAAEQARLARAQAALSEAQARSEAVLAETGERLNALIDVLERFISGQNGK
jgi:septal ring factor EnvC (AmiA/AmiB activator)